MTRHGLVTRHDLAPGADAERNVVRGVLPQQLRPRLDVRILRLPKVRMHIIYIYICEVRIIQVV